MLPSKEVNTNVPPVDSMSEPEPAAPRVGVITEVAKGNSSPLSGSTYLSLAKSVAEVPPGQYSPAAISIEI